MEEVEVEEEAEEKPDPFHNVWTKWDVEAGEGRSEGRKRKRERYGGGGGE